MGEEIKDWDQYLVPIYKLRHGEFTHKVPINFSLLPGKDKDQYSKQIKPLLGIQSAYTNTSGGCIQLQNQPNATDLVSDEVFDKWRNIIMDQLKTFMPESLIGDLKYEYNNGMPFVIVKPCQSIVSLNTYILTRQFASNKAIHVQESVTKCINQDWKAHIELPTKPFYKYEEKLPYSEDDHIEFKHFKKACSADELLDFNKEAAGKRLGLTLFGMMNLPGGGTIFIGASDQGKAMGQPLNQPEEQKFKEGLVKIYRENLEGSKRYSNTQQFVPKDGKDFKIEFIPLGMVPRLISCGKKGCKCHNKRRVLIKISVFQNKGILLMQHPECYKVNDHGRIIKLSIDEWYAFHKDGKSAESHHQMQHGNMKSTGSTVASSSKAMQKPLVSTPNKSSEKGKSAKLSKHQSETSASLDQEMSVLSYKYLSFKKDSSLCNPQPAEKITPENIARASGDYEIFKLRQPCNFNPQCEALLLRYPSIEEKLDIIKKEIGDNTNSFALVESSLFSCFNHDLKASDFFTRIPLKLPSDIKPEHHMLDILAADDKGLKQIFCLFEGDGTHHDQEKSYGLHLVRVMKKQLTEEMKKQKCKRSEVHIKLTILHMECDDLEVFESSASEKLPSAADDTEIKMMKISMASIFLAKKSIFKTRMKSDITIQFSSQQAESLLGLGIAPITIITGGPGTGKSLLAQCLCEKWGKDKSVYVCSTRPLEKFVQYGGKADTFLLKENESVLDDICGLMVNKSCIALEESHMIGCEKESWKSIFEEFRCSKIKRSLFIFRDSEFHDFQNKHSSAQLTTAIEEYRKKYTSGVVRELVLTEVFRNSQIIGSYMYAIQDEPPNHITFRSTMHGDDVAMLVIENLWLDSENNGLILHLRKKLKNSDVAHDHVAILVDGLPEKTLFLAIFRKYWPEVTVHAADFFPPGGIVLDTVYNFTGLEAPFIIYIVSQDNKDDICSLENTKFKTAVVSRAIIGVEFLQDAEVDHQEAVKMKFDKPPTGGQHVIKKQSSKLLSLSEKSTTEEFTFVRELQDMEVKLDEDTVFECEVNRKDVPVDWYINDKAVEAGPQYQIFVEDTIHKLSIKKAKREDGGEIKCIFKKAVTTAKLSVRGSGLKWRREGYEEIRSLAVMTDGSSLVITAEGKTKRPDRTVTFSSTTLQRLSAQGQPLDLPFPYYATKPKVITINSTSSTVVLVDVGSDGDKVYVYSHHDDSWLCRSFSTRRNIQQAAVTDDGYIACTVVSDLQNTLVLMSVTGQEQWSTSLQQGPYPTFLCVSKQLIIVSSCNNETVTVFSRQGELLRTVPRELISKPTGVTCDKAGRVVIADAASMSISILTPEGDFIKTLVKCQLSPLPISLSQDTLLVAESNYDNTSYNLCMYELS